MKTIYSELGAENLRVMVDRFYDLIVESEIKHLFKTDMNVVRQKQFMFLTQFFGGPPLYSNEYGHPRMRMRHMPHKITEEAKDVWLSCMFRAIDSLEVDTHLKESLKASFPKIASHMVNS